MSTLLKGDVRRGRWTAIAVGALALMGHVSLLAAIDFPGPAPGPATVTVESGRYKLENSAISVSWQLIDGRLRPGPVVDRLSGKMISGGNELFAVVLADGRSICDSSMKLVADPRSEDLATNSASVRAANHHAGKCISAVLASTDGSLQVQWRAILRDGDNYVRQELALRARDKDVPLTEIVMLDLPAEGAQTVGSVRGSPVVAGNLFFACEDPLAHNQGQGGRVRCALPWSAGSGRRRVGLCVGGRRGPGRPDAAGLFVLRGTSARTPLPAVSAL